MLGHVPFNLCEVHELSRVALYIRQQALFTLIQRNPAHQVPYAPDTIRQMVQMILAHLPHRAARLVRDMLTSTGQTEVTMLRLAPGTVCGTIPKKLSLHLHLSQSWHGVLN